MDILAIAIAALSLLFFLFSLVSLHLMLYTWEYPERLAESAAPRQFRPPLLSFTVLLPARHEEAVIFETVRRVCQAKYPAELLEVVVICHADDHGTIAEAERAVRSLSSPRARVETFDTPPINKPHGLNVGFQRSENQVVTIFDAEDDIDPDIFSMVNTAMAERGVSIVQAGVQLMNLHDHWFASHNCLEYFFWFKSRLHFHARVGMIPLGGNTVFIRRELIERVGGWDEQCLTEDADIGLRLSALGEQIRVIYDARHVTREETPGSVGEFVRQRTRWLQGFVQILRKGTWLSLPRFGQRALAAYTLSYPLFQALLMLLWPLTFAAVLRMKAPLPVAMISFLPFYILALQYLATAIGAYLFTREYRLRFGPLLPIAMAVTYLPYQWLLGISAVRAVWRELRRENKWEKTVHVGAHRQAGQVPVAPLASLLEEAGSRFGAEQGSVMVFDPHDGLLAIRASRGLSPRVVSETRLRVGEGIVGRVARDGRPVILDGDATPLIARDRLVSPDLRSAIVLPIGNRGATVGVLSLASEVAPLGEEALHWVQERIRALEPAAGYPLAAHPPAEFETVHGD